MEQFDFSIIDNHENTLYFKFIRRGKFGVKVCSPYKAVGYDHRAFKKHPYGCSKPPSGEIVIPLKVEYRGVSHFVREIDRYAFFGCRRIIKVELPETITKIGESAFEGCHRMESINIPNEVTKIDSSAFRECQSLKNVFLPESLQELGISVFDGCKSLEDVHLPNSIIRITSSLFRNCVSLKQVNVPLSLFLISKSAFENCISLKEFEIPPSVTCIEHGAFLGCSLRVSSLSENYVVKDNCLLKVKEDWCSLLYVPSDIEEYEIPEGVTWIHPYVFNSRNNKLRRIKLADSVKVIEPGSFSGCSSLQEVEVSENSKLSWIGGCVFSYCKKLIKITLPSSLECIVRNAFSLCSLTIINQSYNFVAKDNALYTADYKRLIYVCSGVTKFRVDDHVEEIDGSAFSKCVYLRFLILPASLEEIPKLIFDRYKSVECIYTLNPLITMSTCDIPFRGQVAVRNINENEADRLMNTNEIGGIV